ncbi:MAG: response regulator transcription factor [Bacteroidales bacterium]|nr:response regulator transcription factor [Bacteroidales bacterium]
MIRILIVEDQPICRLGIRMTLTNSGISHTIVAETETVSQTIDFLENSGNDIDLILLDYMLPDGTGMDVIEAVRRLHLNPKIVILSGEAGGAVVQQLMDAGVNGYMDKNIRPEELEKVLTTVMNGDDYTEKATMHLQGDIKADMDILSTLTRREMEIITLCASGMSAKQIADELCITQHSVENHKDNIFKKLHIQSTSELILFAFKVGLIS